MDQNELLNDIDQQISVLSSIKTVFGTKTNRFGGFATIDKIESKIASTRRLYFFYLGLSILLGGILYVAGFAQVFDFRVWDLSKSGLLIVLAVGNIMMTARNKMDLERLKMIKYLLGLKQKVIVSQ